MNVKAQNPAWLRRKPQDCPEMFGGSHLVCVDPKRSKDDVGGPDKGAEMGVDRRLSDNLGIDVQWAPGGFLFRSARTGMSKFCQSPSDLDYYLCLYLLGTIFMETVAHPRDSKTHNFRVSWHAFLQYICVMASEACAKENVNRQGPSNAHTVDQP